MLWNTYQFESSTIGLRTAQYWPLSGSPTDAFSQFSAGAHLNSLGIQTGFLLKLNSQSETPILGDDWTELPVKESDIVTLSEVSTGGIRKEDIISVLERYGNQFLKLYIMPSELITSTVNPGQLSLARGLYLSQAFVPALNSGFVDETVQGLYQAYIVGLTTIYIPWYTSSFLIYLKSKESRIAGYLDGEPTTFPNPASRGTVTLNVAEFDPEEGDWYSVDSEKASYFYTDPTIVRIAMLKMVIRPVTPPTSDDLGLGRVGIDRQTFNWFNLLSEAYKEPSTKTVAYASTFLRDEANSIINQADLLNHEIGVRPSLQIPTQGTTRYDPKSEEKGNWNGTDTDWKLKYYPSLEKPIIVSVNGIRQARASFSIVEGNILRFLNPPGQGVLTTVDYWIQV